MVEKNRRVEWLKQEAFRHGFLLSGITSPRPTEHVDVFLDWLDAGHHGEMHYLTSERSRRCRQDPITIFPDCRSILVLAAPYPPASDMKNQDPTRPHFSSYAVGEDYHEVLLERAESLLQSFTSFLAETFKYEIYTDTGPILERDMAQRAGLGWIGKNTCLIHPKVGSYFFLVEVLLELDLPFNPPFLTDHCGSCTRCLDACPTECILPNRTLDATRCISYLTIELKGNIPRELRPRMGNWAFGCDICQQVCPWNIRFAHWPDDPAFQPRSELINLDLTSLMQLEVDEFQGLAHRSPLRRAKRKGLLRNLAVVAGNSQNQTLIGPLTTLLDREKEILPRAHAAWALGEIGGREAMRALQLALEKENDDQVRMEILEALHKNEKQPQ